MADYKVKCPKCGNWALGIINRSTISKGVRGALKKGGMKGVLTAAGTVLPGFGNAAGFVAGTIIDAVYGDEINQMVDGAADMVMEDTNYSFTCPNCDYQWTMEESEILKLINSNDSDAESEESTFDYYWNYFLENTSDICDSRETLLKFLKEMDSDMPRFEFNHSNPEYSMMQYLKSWAALIYILDNGNDEEIIKKGHTAINNCNKGTNDDSEYQYMRAIYDMIAVDESEPKAFGKCNKIYQDYSSYIIENSLLKPESLRRYMDIIYYEKLSSVVFEIEQRKDYQQALKVYQKMTKIDYDTAKVEGNGRLSQYYRFESIVGVNNDLEKAFKYAQDCINQLDLESIEKYSPDNWFDNLWMDNLGYVALICSVKNGPNYNPQMAYRMANIGYKLGDSYNTFLMYVFTDEGTGTKVDKSLAAKFCHEAAERGCEQAKEALKTIPGNSPLSSSSISDSEKEYIDALKEYLSDGEISERERKMLDRVRKALGITTDRAAELEETLKQPLLTDEEKEYIEAYREYLVDGPIDEKSRKRLDIFRKGLGISEERAAELENL